MASKYRSTKLGIDQYFEGDTQGMALLNSGSGKLANQESVLGSQQRVSLKIPASAESLRIARVTAAGLASRVGFNIDEVDDLRLAVDELCFALITHSSNSSSLHLDYTLLGDGVTVDGRIDSHDHPIGRAPETQNDLQWTHIGGDG